MKKLTVDLAVLALAVIAVDVAVHHANGGSIHAPASACPAKPCQARTHDSQTTEAHL